MTRIVIQRARIASTRKRRNTRRMGPGSPEWTTFGFLRIQTPSSGEKSTATTQDMTSAMATTAKDREGVLARGAAREADGDEPRDSHQGAGEHRKGGRAVGEGGGVFVVVAALQPRDHGLDGDHGVVDQQAEGNDEGTQRDALKVDSGEAHHDEHRGEHERNREGHHGARAQAEADQADPEHDRHGLPQGLHEFVHRMLDGHWLVGDERRLDPDWQIRRDLRHRVRDVVAECEDVAALPHGDGEPDAIPPVDAEHWLRWVRGPARDVRDVAECGSCGRSRRS